jgi:hypothetical protein
MQTNFLILSPSVCGLQHLLNCCYDLALSMIFYIYDLARLMFLMTFCTVYIVLVGRVATENWLRILQVDAKLIMIDSSTACNIIACYIIACKCVKRRQLPVAALSQLFGALNS